MKEELDLQKRLQVKIQSYAGTEHYNNSKTAPNKLRRTLDLLMGTNPEVMTQLGITGIPNEPYEAMNSVRSKDLKLVKGTEIFDLTGTGKLTGHHGTPASLLRALEAMDTDNREYVFKYLKDLGVKHGMDPEGILALEGKKVHGKVAHGGDWTGKRTGAFLKPIQGEKGPDFIKRFEKAYNIQMDMNEKAILDPLTQDWQGAMRGASDGLDLPELDLNSTTTPASQRQDATKILRPSANQVREIVHSNPGNPEEIRKQTERIVRATPRTRQQTARLNQLRAGSTPSPGDITPGMRFGRKGIGKVLKIPVLGGAIAAGGALLSGAGAQAAVGEFIEAENPLSGGALADGTVTGMQADERNRPLHYGKNGPNVPRPGQRERAQQLRINPSSEMGIETIGRYVKDSWNTLKQLMIPQ
jgi:hypothetical protein